jgi:hypothetical protein
MVEVGIVVQHRHSMSLGHGGKHEIRHRHAAMQPIASEQLHDLGGALEVRLGGVGKRESLLEIAPRRFDVLGISGTEKDLQLQDAAAGDVTRANQRPENRRDRAVVLPREGALVRQVSRTAGWYDGLSPPMPAA